MNTDARTFFENHLQISGTTKKVAASLGNCSGGTITNYINKGKELKFSTAVKFIDSLFNGDDRFVKMYCVESEKPENIKSALEYLSTNRYFNELRKLIYKCDSFNILGEWTDTYKVVLAFQQRSKSYEDLLDDVFALQLEVKEEQLQALLKIIEANIHHILYESSTFERLIKTIEYRINNLQDDYFKNSLLIRLLELKSHYFLYVKSDTKKAREYAKKIISSKIGTKFVLDAYNIVGTSYIFENADKSLKYINKSIEGLRKIECNDMADEYEFGTKRFIQTYWSKNLTETNENHQESEVAFLMAKRGEREKAVEILDKLKDTPFRKYYRAVAENDPMLHFQSLAEFIKRGEMFYAQLPYKELLKNEVYKEVAKNLLKGENDKI